MPRVPKKLPNWIPQFIDYAKKKEKDKKRSLALDVFEQIVTQRWEKFALKMAENTPAIKRQRTDPLKSLENAMKKVASDVDLNKDDPEKIAFLKNRLMHVMPEQVSFLLAPGLDFVQQLKNVCQEAKESQKHLEQLSAQSSDPVSRSAIEIVSKVHNSLDLICHNLEAQQVLDQGSEEINDGNDTNVIEQEESNDTLLSSQPPDELSLVFTKKS